MLLGKGCIADGNEREEPSGLQVAAKPSPDWGILGKSPKRLPCQHGTVCRKSVACVVGGGAAVTPLHRLALTSRTQTWVTPSAPLWLPQAASACPPRASTVRP